MTSICLCGVPHLSNGCQAFLLNHPHYLGGDMSKILILLYSIASLGGFISFGTARHFFVCVI